jgi:UDP-N-acetylmuramoylalanine--D-glutamate ligase
MDEAIRVARSHLKSGDVVLFSPAGASFDLFKNYQHRGEVFTNTVKELICLDKNKVMNS